MNRYAQLIIRQYEVMLNRGWDKIFWGIDLHDTVFESNYSKDIPTTYYPFSKEVLQMLTKRKDAALMMYTCSWEPEIEKYNALFQESNITFNTVNVNPDAENTAYGCYDKKPYFNVLLDDKAGFVAKEDWLEIYKTLKSLEKACVVADGNGKLMLASQIELVDGYIYKSLLTGETLKSVVLKRYME